jgi:RHS repeat-associated protein
MTTLQQSFGGASGPQVVYTYDSGGRVTAVDRSIGGVGTVVHSTQSYDAGDRLTTLTYKVGGGSALATYLYGYDSSDRLSSETDTSGTYTYNATYTYDNADELTGVTGTNAETYTYDANGNRTMTGYTTPANGGNELTASPGYTYAYDAEGNLAAKTQTSNGNAWTYTYDYRDRLTGVLEKSSLGAVLAQATYTYDALDRRIGFSDFAAGGSTAQTWTVYDGQEPYADFGSSGGLLERYLYGPAVDAILARTSSGGTTAWYLTDHLGTVRDVASTSGTNIDHVAYDSYGNLLSESNPASGDRFKYTGREFDSAIGQYYDRARYYDSVTGRFSGRDPLGFGGGDSNTYRYVHNGPIDSTDPSGLGPYWGGYYNPINYLYDWVYGSTTDFSNYYNAGNIITQEIQMNDQRNQSYDINNFIDSMNGSGDDNYWPQHKEVSERTTSLGQTVAGDVAESYQAAFAMASASKGKGGNDEINRGPKGGKKHTPGHRPEHINQRAKQKGMQKKAANRAARDAERAALREKWNQMSPEQRKLLKGKKGVDPDA